ncbi:hypothetical protein CCP2SC5_360013 [Azospirillaceae bacterium]
MNWLSTNWLDAFTNLTPARSRQLAFIGVGVALIASGVAIMITPVITGAILILIGQYILLRHSIVARRLYVRLKNRFPHALKPIDRWRHRRRRHY